MNNKPGWKVAKMATRPGSRRAYIWQVECPDELPEPDWDNDFGRGMRCRCRRFASEGKARRYVERESARDALA